MKFNTPFVSTVRTANYFTLAWDIDYTYRLECTLISDEKMPDTLPLTDQLPTVYPVHPAASINTCL